MENKLLQTLALLKMNWESPQRKDYLDIFIPFVIECIKDCEIEPITARDIQPIINKKFAISFPERIIDTLLTRARKKKLLKMSNKALFKDEKALAESKSNRLFQQHQEKLINRYEVFISELIKFAKNIYSKTWNTKYAEKNLFEYLDINGVTILSTLTSGVPLKQVIGKKKRSNKDLYIIAKFILNAEQNNTAEFSYFESIVQGHILASSMYLPDISTANKKLNNTSFYFDTPFLIFSLGYAGVERQVACKELLDLLNKSAGGLFCFEHTILEIEGILHACSVALDPTSPEVIYGFAAEYFLANHFTETDVMELKNSIRDDIQNTLNVKIVDKPEYCEHSINEEYLRADLERQLNYSNPRALDLDVDSISAVIRLRKGKLADKIEDCKVVFVTTNYGLARVVRSFFNGNNYNNYRVPPCITDHRLTAHIWLKMPTKAPGLPKKRIIADCYAAIQPSDKFWKRYFEQIEKLKKKGNISEEQYYLLRYDIGVRKNLKELSQGDEDIFDDEVWQAGTVSELIENAKEEIEKEIRLEYATEYKAQSTELEEMSDAFNTLKEKYAEGKRAKELKKIHRQEKISKLSRKTSSILTDVIKFGFFSSVAIGSILSFYNYDIIVANSMPGYLLGIVLAAIFSLTVINQIYGITVNQTCSSIESIIYQGIERLLQKIM